MKDMFSGMKWKGIIVVFLAAGAGVSMFGGAEAEDAAPAAAPVREAVVESREFRETTDTSGFIRGVRQTDVAAKTGGYVTGLLVEEGDTVYAGQAIATLDGSELSAMRESASDSYVAAKRAADEAEDYYDQLVDEAETAYRKVKDAYDDGNVGTRDLRIAKEAVKSAEKARDAQVASARAELAQAAGGHLVADVAAKNATVVAPFSGVVTRRYVALGGFVAPGMPIYTVATPDELELRVSVPATVGDAVSVGAEVRILPEHGDGLTGTVTSVARAVGETTSRTVVRVRIERNDGRTLPAVGTYAEAIIPVGEARAALSVPESAVVERYDDTFVFVEQDGVAAFRRVTLGEVTDGFREVVEGLEAGERIIVEGQGHLRDGDAVSVSE